MPARAHDDDDDDDDDDDNGHNNGHNDGHNDGDGDGDGDNKTTMGVTAETAATAGKTASRRPVHVSQKVAIPLSIIMTAAALLVFTRYPSIGGPDPPIFTTTRLPQVSMSSPGVSLPSLPLAARAAC